MIEKEEQIEVGAEFTFEDEGRTFHTTVSKVSDKTVWYAGEAEGMCRKVTFLKDFTPFVEVVQVHAPITEGVKAFLDTTMKFVKVQQEAGKPWEKEPNAKYFTHEGVKCLIVRHATMGNLCGYVKVPAGKLLDKIKAKMRRPRPGLKAWPGIRDKDMTVFKKSSFAKVKRQIGYAIPEVRGMECHGGITFVGKPYHCKGERGVWLGFDCAHCDDLVPGMLALGIRPMPEAVYADMDYVAANCKLLAAQIKEKSE